jgi:hypothetical protein
MLQIDHVYEFLFQSLFKEFEFWHLKNGVPKNSDLKITDVSIFTPEILSSAKIFFYDQEPFIPKLATPYIDMFSWEYQYSVDEMIQLTEGKNLPYSISIDCLLPLETYIQNPTHLHKQQIVVTSEYSSTVLSCADNYNFKTLYYFFHGFAALDWYRGFYALNYDKQVIKDYQFDFVSFNRIIADDRSYRIYFVSQLVAAGLIDRGQISFNVTDYDSDWRDEVTNTNSKLSADAKLHIEKYLTNYNKLTIDSPTLPGSASADIPRNTDAFWHVVTETVFYYDKLHLTEKIFKPIVMKQPFMLLAAPGNLAYLKSYGFKTFEGIIDESYDTIEDNDQRTEAVVRQLAWYCALSAEEKRAVIEAIAPIVEYNFHHFYGEFKHKITRELLDNTQELYKTINYNDTCIDYDTVYKVLTR